MKKMLVVVIVIFMGSFKAFAANDNTLLFAFEDKQLFPYYIGNSTTVDDELPGLSVELLRIAASQVGIAIDFQRMPWKRCKIKLQAGKVDGIFNASYKKSRLSMGYYPTIDKSHNGTPDSSKRLTTLRYVFYKTKGSGFYWDGANVSLDRHQPVGSVLGYSIVGDLKDLNVPVREYVTSEKIIHLLAMQRISAYADLESKVDKMINDNIKDYGNIVKVEPPIKTKDYYLMLSRQLVENDKALAYKIWQAIEHARESSGFAKVKARYGLK